ncbi:MAG TPA: IclR family transcriptional regulator [Ramlibacter sp.]|nr:IclR family transcriptional regulator [Ramlibacter sp.]
MPKSAVRSRSHDSKDSSGVQAVDIALRVIAHLASQTDAVGVTSIAEALGTTKSRVYRHLQTLVQHGFAQQEAIGDRYLIGQALINIGLSISENYDLVGMARNALWELREALGHSSVVSRIEPDGIRVLLALTGKSPIEIGVKPGSLLSLHCTAQGKVALAFGDPEMRERILGSKLAELTPQTLTTPRALVDELAKVKKQGWATAPNEALIGLNALAAPVFDGRGMLAGTISIVDSIQFIPAVPTAEQIKHTLIAAAKVSSSLGYKPRPVSREK